MSGPKRLTARVIPPNPITVAIVDDAANPVAYGVVADISESGACVWTDASLVVGTHLSFRISFAQPPDVEDVAAVVVWSELTPDPEGRGALRSGVEWLDATRACRRRLFDLAGRAVRPNGAEDYPFQARWTVLPSYPGA